MSLTIDNSYDESAEASRYAASVVEEYIDAVSKGQDPRAYLKEKMKSIDEMTWGWQNAYAARNAAHDRPFFEIRKIFIAGKRALQNQLSKLPAAASTAGEGERQRTEKFPEKNHICDKRVAAFNQTDRGIRKDNCNSAT